MITAMDKLAKAMRPYLASGAISQVGVAAPLEAVAS